MLGRGEKKVTGDRLQDEKRVLRCAQDDTLLEGTGSRKSTGHFAKRSHLGEWMENAVPPIYQLDRGVWRGVKEKWVGAKRSHCQNAEDRSQEKAAGQGVL